MSTASVSGRLRAQRDAAKADREFYALTPEQRAERERAQRENQERLLTDPEYLRTIESLMDGSYRK